VEAGKKIKRGTLFAKEAYQELQADRIFRLEKVCGTIFGMVKQKIN
jgi:hypothetical protein